MNMLELPAPLWRRLAAALYDGLLLIALWLAAGLVLVVGADLAGTRASPRFVQGYLFLVSFLFFGWFWTHGGQTLGLRAWRLRVSMSDGTPLRWPAAMLRFVLSVPSWMLGGLGLLWSVVDSQRQSAHDRLSGTRVMLEPKDSVLAREPQQTQPGK